MLFSWSKYNHMAAYINGLVHEFKGHGYQKISLDKCLKASKSKIHAYKVIKEINKKKAKAFTEKMKIAKYDAKGAIYSEAEKWKWLAWIFKKKANDDEIFCNECWVRFFQDQGYFPMINPNLFSPQEALERFIKLKIIEPNFEVWK